MYEPKYLIFVSEDNHNKYYKMEKINDKLHVEYGRIGNSSFQTCDYSLSLWDKKYNEKIKKGYVDKTELVSDLIEVESPQKNTGLKDIINKSVANIIKRLQSFAKATIDSNYRITSQKTTQQMVDEAQILINTLINIEDVTTFNNVLLEIFATIPRKMAKVADYLAKCRNDFSGIIQREQNLLDTMAGNIVNPKENKIQDDLEPHNNETTVLDEMGISMEETNDADISLIKEMLGKDSDRYINSWRVCNHETQKNFEKFCKDYNINNKKLLWHGSRNENFIGIMKLGLKIRPSNAVFTGSMFSDGLYFSTLARKSIGYTSTSGSYWAKGNSNSGFMAIFEVAYGNPYTVYQHTYDCYNINFNRLQKMNPPCHCLYASPDKGMLRNPEIVFYRPDQVTIKYLVEIH